MRIMVTGATGFLGRHVINSLLREKVEIVSVASSGGISLDGTGFCQCYCDLTCRNSVKSLMEIVRPEAVIHLAACSNIRDAEKDKIAAFLLNVRGTEWIAKNAPKDCRIVFASSVMVYGKEFEKGGVTIKSNPSPISAYGQTKLWAEKTLDKPQHVIARLCGMVGPGMSRGIVPDIVQKLRQDEPTLRLIGDAPGSSRPFVAVERVADALVHFSIYGHTQKVVNLCPGDSLTAQEVASLIMQKTGIHKPIQWLGEGAGWKGDVPSVQVDDPFFEGTSSEAVLEAVC